MKLLIRYVRQQWKYLLWMVLVFLLYFIFFILYHLPMKAVIYPMFLCFIMGILFVLIQFMQERKKYLYLEQLMKHSAELIEELPKADGPVEEKFCELITKLTDEVLTQHTVEESKYRNTVEYFTVWVHQIKTPIASMQLTLQKEDSSAARKMSSDLLRIEQYVDMVLTFLRLDEGASDYVFKKYDLDALICQAVRKFGPDFIGKKLYLEYEKPEEIIVTDEKWFVFVLEQLLSNALKYTRTGGIRIYLKPGKILCIEDTGIGIAPEDLPRIFDKGYTGYNGRSDKKATGLGLYLCKRICSNLRLRITAESTVGKGTSMNLYLEQYDLRTE